MQCLQPDFEASVPVGTCLMANEECNVMAIRHVPMGTDASKSG